MSTEPNQPNERTRLITRKEECPFTKSQMICLASTSALLVLVIGSLGYLLSKKKSSNGQAGGGGSTGQAGGGGSTPFLSNLGVANDSPYLWKLSGSSGSDASCSQNSKKSTCYQEIDNLATQWVGIQNSGGWFDLEYDVFDGNNNYIGHFGISLTPQAVTISNEEGITATISAYQAGQAQQVTVTPNIIPPAPCNITHNATLSQQGSLAAGVNLSGEEWGGSVTEIVPPTCADIDTAYQNLFYSLRIPFKLEYGSSNGQTIDANSTYVQNYLALVKHATIYGGEVIVEPHNYMQFNSQPITPQQCQSLIGQSFVGLFQNIPNVVVEAMNEPPGGTDLTTLSNCYDGLIKAARAQGYLGPLVIEGATWGTPNVWTNADGTPSIQFTTLSKFFIDDATYGNVQMGIHCYFNGATGGGDGLSECVPAGQALEINRLPELTALAKQYGIKIRSTEMGVINSSNCNAVLVNVLQHFSNNTDVYVGYNWWTLTPSNPTDWGPDGYPLLLNPPTDPRYTELSAFIHTNNYSGNYLPDRAVLPSSPQNNAANANNAFVMGFAMIPGVIIGLMVIYLLYRLASKAYERYGFFSSRNTTNEPKIKEDKVALNSCRV